MPSQPRQWGAELQVPMQAGNQVSPQTRLFISRMRQKIDKMEIYVGNLSYNTEESSLQDAFSAFGTVERVQLIKDKFTGRSKGFAFVTMNDLKEAQNAMDAVNGTQLDGRAVTVNQARPREDRPERPRGGGGGGGDYGSRPRSGGGGGGGGGRRDFRGGGGRH